MSFNVYLSFAASSLISCLSNFVAFFYINRTYDVRKSLYYILAFDSALAAVLSLFGGGVFLYLAFINSPGPIICSLLMLTIPLLVCLQPYFTFLISLIR